MNGAAIVSGPLPPRGVVFCIEEQCVCGVGVSYNSIGRHSSSDRFILTRLVIHYSYPNYAMPGTPTMQLVRSTPNMFKDYQTR
jgi:hypothetical protein